MTTDPPDGHTEKTGGLPPHDGHTGKTGGDPLEANAAWAAKVELDVRYDELWNLGTQMATHVQNAITDPELATVTGAEPFNQLVNQLCEFLHLMRGVSIRHPATVLPPEATP